MNIPFVDLSMQYQALKPEIDSAIQSVISETAFVRGPYVTDFEQNYARRYGAEHCISTANGTDAIYIALKALGIGTGDEVITTACSWISTSETISQTGAKVVFADIESDYYTIDPDSIEEKITDRTRAIIPVHLYGQSVDMERIVCICNRYNLYLIEDCAQAHFAEFNGKKVGTFGDFGTFSFYPGKNLGAYGDAGAIITDNDDLADMARMFANHGSLVKHQHQIEGINSRMDGIQAAVLSVKLPYIDQWNQARYENALKYNELLKDIEEIIVPKIRPDSSHIFHLYVIRTKYRDHLQQALKEKGIGVGVHYPKALPFLEAYDYLNAAPEDFPVAYKYQDEILSLPMYPELQQSQIEYIAGCIIEALTEHSGIHEILSVGKNGSPCVPANIKK
jgi:dTDP-4-amino-4,6-dideoxygalactose transaminase